MDWRIQWMDQNDCYKQGRKLMPKGIMVHATASPGVMAEDWYKRWNKGGVEKCVHAFVDNRETVQYLPWDMRGWHAGGSANNTHIGFEICEDKGWNEAYFISAWENAVELAAHLCARYGLTQRQIISHKEGHAQGIASNHGDPDHWWGKFNRTMDDFRAAVAQKLAENPAQEERPEDAPKTMRVCVPEDDFLAVRAAPSNAGALVDKLAPGEIVKVYEVNASGWCKTKGGWSYGGKGYLQEISEAPSLGRKRVNTPGDILNVRDEANAKGKKLGELAHGSQVTICGLADNGWMLIQQGNLRGWVNGRYLVNCAAKPELTRILKLTSPNMRGEDVRWAQNRLNELGYDCGAADGIFGPNTDRAVKSFQMACNLARDGDIGPKTWEKL